MNAIYIDCSEFMSSILTGQLRGLVPELEIHEGTPDEDEVIRLLHGSVAAVVGRTYVPAHVLEGADRLKVVVFLGAGASSYIDLAAAERLDMRVHAIRNYGDRTVAEFAIALMFAAGRKIAVMDRDIRAGIWLPADGIEFFGKTLGVVGVGGIGSEMARLGHALGMKVLAWDCVPPAPELPCHACSMGDLLRESDVVSVHLALNQETRGLIGAPEFALMKPGALFVNTARSEVVDEAALIDALQTDRLAHAALDVFDREPLPEAHPLARLANVTLTAHAGFKTREASTRLIEEGFRILREELDALSGR